MPDDLTYCISTFVPNRTNSCDHKGVMTSSASESCTFLNIHPLAVSQCPIDFKRFDRLKDFCTTINDHEKEFQAGEIIVETFTFYLSS